MFEILSLTDSLVNLQQTHIYISQHILNMSLHYLVKCECHKIGGNLKCIVINELMINDKVV